MSELFEYKQTMDGLHYTDEQKKLLAEQALRAAGQAAPRRRKPVWRTALIAAAVAAALMVGAGATGVLKSAVDALSPIFGGSAAQTEVIDKLSTKLAAPSARPPPTTASPSPPTPSSATRTTPPSSTPSAGTTAPPCCRRAPTKKD